MLVIAYVSLFDDCAGGGGEKKRNTQMRDYKVGRIGGMQFMVNIIGRIVRVRVRRARILMKVVMILWW